MGLIDHHTTQKAAQDVREGDRIVLGPKSIDFQVVEANTLNGRTIIWAYRMATAQRSAGEEQIFAYTPDHEVEVLPAG